jgi:hypothetical protein
VSEERLQSVEDTAHALLVEAIAAAPQAQPAKAAYTQSLQNFQASNFNTDTNEGVWKAKQDANSAIPSQLAGLY